METLLKNGYLSIGSNGVELFLASFTTWNRYIFTEISNKGFKHLMLMLEAKASNNLSIAYEADKKFVHPANPAKLTRVEHIILCSSIDVCLDQKYQKFKAYCAQTKTPPQRSGGRLISPGIHVGEGIGDNIEEAIINANESVDLKKIDFSPIYKLMIPQMT